MYFSDRVDSVTFMDRVGVLLRNSRINVNHQKRTAVPFHYLHDSHDKLGTAGRVELRSGRWVDGITFSHAECVSIRLVTSW